MNPELIEYVFVDEAGKEFTPHIDAPYQVLDQVLTPFTKFRVGGAGPGRYYALQFRVTLRRIPPPRRDDDGRRWIVLEAREVIGDVLGEALTKPGRRLGSKAMYGGESLLDCQQRYQTLFSLVPEPFPL